MYPFCVNLMAFYKILEIIYFSLFGSEYIFKGILSSILTLSFKFFWLIYEINLSDI